MSTIVETLNIEGPLNIIRRSDSLSLLWNASEGTVGRIRVSRIEAEKETVVLDITSETFVIGYGAGVFRIEAVEGVGVLKINVNEAD